MNHAVCIFCASSDSLDPQYVALSAEMGRLCARNDFHVIYGGAHSGMMGALADSALAHGGKVTGVIPEILKERERAHTGLTELIVTQDMHERQKTMADLADGFVILPGGLGTLAEFFEIVTWKQIGLHNKPILILNHQGFWDDLLAMITKSTTLRFLHQNPQELFDVLSSLDEIFSFFAKK